MSGYALASRLAALGTATFYELGAKAVMSSEIRMLSGDCCVAGPAFTVMCHPGDNLMIHVGVARAKPGDVLVVQCHDAAYGVWGEVLTVAAIARGIAALVLDGSVRDLAAIRRQVFPSSLAARVSAEPSRTESARSARRFPAVGSRSGRATSSRPTRAGS